METGSLRRNRVRARAGSAWQTARRPERGGEGHTGCAVLELPSCRWYLKPWHQTRFPGTAWAKRRVQILHSFTSLYAMWKAYIALQMVPANRWPPSPALESTALSRTGARGPRRCLLATDAGRVPYPKCHLLTVGPSIHKPSRVRSLQGGCISHVRAGAWD